MTEMIRVTGGARLFGQVEVSGAKNACLPIMAATLLASGTHQIQRVPALTDVDILGQILKQLGCDFSHVHDQELIKIQVPDSLHLIISQQLAAMMRASVVLLGPLLTRFGHCMLPFPGGDAIGVRPIGEHIRALRALGASIEEESHCLVAQARKRLRGTRVRFDITTVTGTENLIMAAVLAQGETEICHAAREPEIVDLCEALRHMGALIEGEGTDTIRIQGRDSLKPMDYRVMPDRIEAGTLAVAVAMTQGSICLQHACAAHMGATLDVLVRAGVQIKEQAEGLQVTCEQALKPVQISTAPYPGLATDMQAQLMAMTTFIQGVSTIEETIYENRFGHVKELQKMGAHIHTTGRLATIQGVSTLHGASVVATDLRASACLILAGLVAQGQTHITGIHHLDRGYARLEHKLASLGAQIQRLS